MISSFSVQTNYFFLIYQTGGYTVANLLWDMMQARNMIPSLPTVEAYYKGLKVSFYLAYLFIILEPCLYIYQLSVAIMFQEREIPEDDPRLMLVTSTLKNLQARAGPGGGR